MEAYEVRGQVNGRDVHGVVVARDGDVEMAKLRAFQGMVLRTEESDDQVEITLKSLDLIGTVLGGGE